MSRRWLPGLFLFLLTCGVYAREPFNGFIWDDPQYVVNNPTLKTSGGLWTMWTEPLSLPQYYPMVHTTFWVEARFFGTDDAAGYHVDNVLLHALAAVLLWRALLAIDVPWPWLAAAVFAVHPVTVESVAWVTERKNVLSLVFYLLAFHAYRRSGFLGEKGSAARGLAGREAPVRTGGRRRAAVTSPVPKPHPRRWYAASIALFVLALLSKTVTCSFPAAMLLIVWWKRGRVTRSDVRPLLPMFAIGLALGAVTAHLEHANVGASGRDFRFSPLDRILIAGRVPWFYAAKIVWPTHLLFMYPRWHIDAGVWWQWSFPLAGASVLIGLYLARRRLGRGPLVAVLFFVGTLVPAMGFFNVYPMRYSFVADHFQYLAAIGAIVLFVAMLDRLVRLLPLVRPYAAAALLVPLAVLTWRQQAIYRSAETLWRDTIARNPQSWMAHVNLANVLRKQGHEQAATAEIATALALGPDQADPHFNMGSIYARRGQWAAATREFRRSTELGPEIPATWEGLASVLWEHPASPADTAEAVTDARRAVEVNPGAIDARRVLADFAAATGDWQAATKQYQAMLALNDQDPAAHECLGNCLLQLGQYGPAAIEFQRSLTINPRSATAWAGFAAAAARSGDPADAAAAFRHARQLDPHVTPAQ